MKTKLDKKFERDEEMKPKKLSKWCDVNVNFIWNMLGAISCIGWCASGLIGMLSNSIGYNLFCLMSPIWWIFAAELLIAFMGIIWAMEKFGREMVKLKARQRRA